MHRQHSIPATPSLSKISCFSSSGAPRSNTSFVHHHDPIISIDKFSLNFPLCRFDGGVHASHRPVMRSPVSNTPCPNFPLSSRGKSSAPSTNAAERSLRWNGRKRPLAPPPHSSSSSSSSLVPSSPSSSPSAAWMGLKDSLYNNSISSSLSSSPCPLPSKSCIQLKCSYLRTNAAKAPLTETSLPSSSFSSLSSASPISPYHQLGSSARQAGKCNCNLLSRAKGFISEYLGMESVEEDKKFSQEEDKKFSQEVSQEEEDDCCEEFMSQGSPQSAVKVPRQREGSQASMRPLAQRWREIQGLNHWEGLLDPLDLELRRMLLFYGDFNQAVYDSFETDEHSKYTGACRFSKEDFFKGVRLVNGREVQYDVVRYLYATSTTVDIHGLVLMKSYSREAWSKESNWIGYIAVSNDEATKVLGRRDFVIIWRGTMRPFEWLDDFKFGQADVTPLLPPSQKEHDDSGDEPSIEQGWLNIYTAVDSKSAFTSSSARDQIMHEVKVQLNKYKDEDVSITILGHSLGAALAVVNAFDIAVNKVNVREGKEATLVTAFVFGCPSVGDETFAKKCEELEGLRILRIKNKIDLITHYPGWLMGYRDVGDEFIFDSRDSTYLKKSKTPGDWHNLEVHLHMVAGTQGAGNPYKFVINRNVALINKSSQALRDDFLVPASWWQMQFKGLVQREDGFWYMPDREEGKRPKPEPLNDEIMAQETA